MYYDHAKLNINSYYTMNNMSILLLTNYSDDIENMTIDDCVNRIDYLAYHVFNSLKAIPNVIINIRQICTNMKVSTYSISPFDFPTVDHIIYINKTGFKGMNPTFVTFIKSFARCSISSISDGIKNLTPYDNIVFSYSKKVYDPAMTIGTHKEIGLHGIIGNIKLYEPAKMQKMIYILIQKSYSVELDLIINKIKLLIDTNKSNDISFMIGLLSDESVDMIILDDHDNYDNNYKISETKYFNKYVDYLDEIRKADMYFIVSNQYDTLMLYELALANVLIISNIRYVNYYLINKLNILTYEYTRIMWDDIFKAFYENVIRDELCGEQGAFDAAGTIIDELNKHMRDSRDLNIDDCNKIEIEPKKRYYLNVDNIQRPHMCNCIINQNPLTIIDKPGDHANDVIKPPVKRMRIYLQK